MRSLVIAVSLLVLSACDSSTDPGAPVEPVPQNAIPYQRPWPTASDAVTAECSAFCRWEVKCEGAELGACEADCYHSLCDGVDCEAPPSGTDELLETCIRAMHVEAASPQACTAGDFPFNFTDACRALVRPSC